MVSSQDAAIAAALTELGYDLQDRVVEVQEVVRRARRPTASSRPATRSCRGQRHADRRPPPTSAKPSRRTDGQAVRASWSAATASAQTVEITPKQTSTGPRVGIQLGRRLRLPVRRARSTSTRNIGGPSAGLMFSLAIYDTLTPGSLTGGDDRRRHRHHRRRRHGRPDRRHPAEDRRRPRRRRQALPGAAGQLRATPSARPNERHAAGPRHTMHDAVKSIEAWVDEPGRRPAHVHED